MKNLIRRTKKELIEIIEQLEYTQDQLKADMNDSEKLIGQFRDSIKELAIINDMASSLIFVQDQDELFSLLFNLANEIIIYKRCAAYLFNDANALYEMKSQRFANKEFLLAIENQIEEGLIDWVMKERKSLIIPGSVSEYHEEGSFVIIPMIGKESNIGFFELFIEIEEGKVNRQLTDLLFLVTNQAALAIYNNRLLKELKEKNKQLELSQEAIIHSSRMAAVGTLASGIAHEINTPLSAISMRSQRLEKKATDKGEVVKNQMREIQNDIRQISFIINKLQIFSKTRQNTFSSYNINDVVENIVRFNNLNISSKNIDIKISLLDDIPENYGDSSLLEQALNNIVLNSIEHLGKGNVISIKTSLVKGSSLAGLEQYSVEGDSEDVFIAVYIEDNGPGIKKELLAHVFDPFFTTKVQWENLGLGLYQSYSIIKKHKGDISVDSILGNGTSFTITLPIIKE